MNHSFSLSSDFANSIDDALEIIKLAQNNEKPFELLLTDTVIQGEPFTSITQRIRNDPLMNNLPIILMTTFGRRSEDKKEIEESGVNIFFFLLNLSCPMFYIMRF